MQNESVNKIPLYHVGCGIHLYDEKPGQTMAIACSCGAGSPIMVSDLQDTKGNFFGLPGSLISILAKRPSLDELPHLEYYLGFSTFQAPVKDAWVEVLKGLGMISMGECSEEKCQRRFTDLSAKVANGEGGW